MLDARNRCSKCNKKTSVARPGLVCQECGKTYHGSCLVPPLGATQLNEMVRSGSPWFCKSCRRTKERRDLKMKTVLQEKTEVKRNMDMVNEIKELLELAERALDQLLERHNKLVQLNKLLAQENLVLSKRLANMDTGNKMKVEFIEMVTNKKQNVTKAQYVENALKLAQARAEGQGDEEGDVTKDFTTFAKYAGLNKGEMAAFQMQGKISKLKQTWIVHLALFLCLIIYTFIGAAIFWAIEKPRDPDDPPRDKKTMINDYESNAKQLIANQSFNSVSDTSKFHNDAVQLLKKYDEDIKKKYEYENLRRPDGELKWEYLSSVFFCSTVYTTIGYGNMYPTTPVGQIAVMLYATIGIPLFLITLADFGAVLTRCIKFLWKYYRRVRYTGSCRKKKKGEASPGYNEGDDFQLPIWLALLITFVYMILGMVLFHFWENWGFLDSFYFVFESIATIGYGDFVPQKYVYLMPAMFYLLFGLAVCSMTLNVAREKIIETMDRASAKIGQTLEQYADEIEVEEPIRR